MIGKSIEIFLLKLSYGEATQCSWFNQKDAEQNEEINTKENEYEELRNNCDEMIDRAIKPCNELKCKLKDYKWIEYEHNKLVSAHNQMIDKFKENENKHNKLVRKHNHLCDAYEEKKQCW